MASLPLAVTPLQFHSIKPAYATRVGSIQVRALALLKQVEVTCVCNDGKASAKGSLASRLRALGESLGEGAGTGGLDVESVVEYALRMVDVLQGQVDVQVSDEMYMAEAKAEAAAGKGAREQAALVEQSVSIMLGNVQGVDVAGKGGGGGGGGWRGRGQKECESVRRVRVDHGVEE